MVFKLIPLCVLVAFSILSCKKQEPYAVPGTSEVDIIFVNPKDGETFTGSPEVSIEARIESNDLMSGWQISITDANTGFSYEAYQDLYEQTMFTVHHHWTPSGITSETIDITLDALDQNMNVLQSKTVRIKYLP